MSFLKNKYGDLNYSYYCNEYQKSENKISDIKKLEDEKAIYQKEFQRDLEYIEQHKSHLFSSLDLLKNTPQKEFSIRDLFFRSNLSKNDSNYNQKIVSSIKFQIRTLIDKTKSSYSMERLTERFNLTIESVYPSIQELIEMSNIDIELKEFDKQFENLFQCCQSAKNLSDKIEAINTTSAKFVEEKQKKEVEKLKNEKQKGSSKTNTDGRVTWKKYEGLIQEKWEEAIQLDKNQTNSVKHVQKKVLEEFGDEIPEKGKGGPSKDTILRYNDIKKD
jgi:hypothetical protein